MSNKQFCKITPVQLVGTSRYYPNALRKAARFPTLRPPAAWPGPAPGSWGDGISFPAFFAVTMSNNINATIPAKDLADALDHLKKARAILDPHLHPLTPKERKTLYKLGDKSVGFMNKLLTYATNTPAFVPAFIDLAELKQDVGVATDLGPVEQFAAQLALDLNSTKMLAGSEGMDQTSPIYKNIKFQAEQNQPGAQAAYDDLSKQFPGRPSKKAAPTA